jgi:hypothetical protein
MRSDKVIDRKPGFEKLCQSLISSTQTLVWCIPTKCHKDRMKRTKLHAKKRFVESIVHHLSSNRILNEYMYACHISSSSRGSHPSPPGQAAE